MEKAQLDSFRRLYEKAARDNPERWPDPIPVDDCEFEQWLYQHEENLFGGCCGCTSCCY